MFSEFWLHTSSNTCFYIIISVLALSLQNNSSGYSTWPWTTGERYFMIGDIPISSGLDAAVEICIESSLKNDWEMCILLPTLASLEWVSLRPNDCYWVYVLSFYSISGVCICLINNHLSGSTGQILKVESAMKSESCSKEFQKYWGNAEKWVKGKHSTVKQCSKRERYVFSPQVSWSVVMQHWTSNDGNL